MWSAIDSMDRIAQLVGKDRRRVTGARSEAFIRAAVRKTHAARSRVPGRWSLSPPTATGPELRVLGPVQCYNVALVWNLFFDLFILF